MVNLVISPVVGGLIGWAAVAVIAINVVAARIAVRRRPQLSR